MSAKTFGERIAEILVDTGLLSPGQLQEAQRLQQKQGGRLLKLLTEHGFITEQDMAVCLGRCLGKPPIQLQKLRVPAEVVNLIPKKLAMMYRLVPVAVLDNKVFVAMADPMNILALDDLRARLKKEILPMVAPERCIHEMLQMVA